MRIHGPPAKDVVEHRRRISVFELTKGGTIDTHPIDLKLCESDGIRLRWHRVHPSDTYVELSQRGPNNYQSTFNLVTTPCNYGGRRYWLECPKCERRVGILYEHNDDFACRMCLDLRYLSQRMNYRTIVPMLQKIMEFEKMEEPKRPVYGGKHTKAARRYDKLYQEVEAGSRMVVSRLNGS